ncbi:DnaJ-domain-containing protein [Lindgomyces ingoldianus]|uniref:DnaJ-domain-containing protein n=1 Tax=Lindgomyces ingoldianus TaxID=673940 RepID=A0ACB6QXK2_9PLEO|nr:DnaJ-domain-containing protein [Lindgomyces ingoldianus]KAF2471646.1 DnaJ-domain-containing protein [Lindgomyces ingoldianus]
MPLRSARFGRSVPIPSSRPPPQHRYLDPHLTPHTTAPVRHQASSFHTSTTRSSDSTPNHYEILSLTPSATLADIKRQFFALSKQHHPDKNPDDASASTRFVRISEAYHVLSSPEKRTQYDAQLHGQHLHHHHHYAHHKGSYSSAGFAGSRPASGLSKKRGTFRGPPPSFYKNGGYGQHHAKRTAHAHDNTPGGGEEAKEDQGSYGRFGGFGPGQTGQGDEVPHFNNQKHKKTHDHINEHIYGRRRSRGGQHIPDGIDRDGMLVNFVVVAGVLGVIGFGAKVMGNDNSPRTTKRNERAPERS